jgi:hypothetical protein
MAKFTTRVELHAATEEDYENLHAAMEAAGFSRTIEASDGVSYLLPPAEYNRSGGFTVKQVLDSAETAARTTGKRFSILVTEGNRQWMNLQPAD